MTDKEKILAEIERRLEELNPKKGEFMGRPLRDVNPRTFPRESELEKLLGFINSLPEVPVSRDLEEAAKELSIGEYKIPKGLVARIRNGVVTVRESRQRLEVTEYRCRDCKHYGCGHATDSRFTTTVCLDKPKELKHKRIKDQLYYHVPAMHKICSSFDLREEE